MNLKKLIVSTSILSISIVPISFVVSCGSNGESKDIKISETIDLENFFKNNSDAITPLGSQVPIFNFVEFNGSWRNFDDLISKNYLSKYVTISDQLKEILKKDNYRIYKKIKRITIQPKKDSRDLTILFYLNKSNTDINLVEFKVSNALTANFIYQNLIEVSNDIKIELYETSKEFSDDWKKATNKNPDLNALKTILRRAFNFNDSLQEKIVNAIVDKEIEISSGSNQVSLLILQKGLDKGFIFQIGNSSPIWSNNLISGVLVK